MGGILGNYRSSLIKRKRSKEDIDELVNKVEKLINERDKLSKDDLRYNLFQREIDSYINPVLSLEYN